jgi:hypothetical protein
MNKKKNMYTHINIPIEGHVSFCGTSHNSPQNYVYVQKLFLTIRHRRLLYGQTHVQRVLGVSQALFLFSELEELAADRSGRAV